MVSYVVISWQGLHLLQRLIPQLTAAADSQIIVVDNGSTDGTAQYLRQFQDRLTIVSLPKNFGVAYARNRGIELAKGDWICILDNDICFEEKTILAMVDYMEQNEEVGMVGCRLLYPDGIVQDSCKLYPGIIEKWKNIRYRGKIRYSYPEKMQTVFEPEYVIGACQLIRKKVVDKIGLLDEHIFYGPEDCDYCLRVRQNGWKVIYLPTVSMVHDCQRKTNANPSSPLGWEHIKGLFYFYRKHGRFIG